MNSMTGFGCASGEEKNAEVGFRVEVSSVNRKQFELKFALPREIGFYESKLRQLIAQKISRGSLVVRVDFIRHEDDSSSSEKNTNSLENDLPESSCTPLKVNRSLIRQLVELSTDLTNTLPVRGEFSVAELLSIPGVLEPYSPDYSTPEIENLLCKVTMEALDNMIEMRRREGAHLLTDTLNRLSLLEQTLSQIEPLVKEYPKMQYEKLLARIRETGLSAEADDDRLCRELVIYADKADVTEEITRLHSHFKNFRSILAKENEPIGRQLDFMTQEIFREINTLSNKCGTVEVSPLAVIMKTELEKIREQIQNVE